LYVLLKKIFYQKEKFAWKKNMKKSEPPGPPYRQSLHTLCNVCARSPHI
jgi:hypothetical protein